MAAIGVQLSTIQPSAPRDFSPLPKGDYTVIVSGSEMKATKAGDGHYLSMEYTVIDGEHQNRKAWENLNIANKDPKVCARALGDLAALATACGVIDPQDTTELHDIPFVIGLAIKKGKDKDGYPRDEQSVTGYKSVNLGAAAPAAAARAPAPAASFTPPPAAARPGAAPAPWAK